MKKFIFLIPLVLCSYISEAQLFFNIQAGVSTSSLDNRLSNGQKIINERFTGTSLQAGFQFIKKNRLAFNANLGLIQKGGSEFIQRTDPAGNDGSKSRSNFAFTYATVNAQIDYSFLMKSKINPFLSAGPRIDYLVSTSNNLLKPDEYNRISPGLITGAGIKVKIKKSYIGARADYWINFSKIRSTTSNTISDRTIDFKAFVLIPL